MILDMLCLIRMNNYKCVFLFLLITVHSVCPEDGHCSKAFGCSGDSLLGKVTRYILYDVNGSEGFNLKRDVYMRMSMFVRYLAQKSNQDWHLVLPPWSKQWHWSQEESQVSYSWHNFFHIPSLQLYSPVIEMEQFYADHGQIVDQVFVLQHFPEFYDWAGGTAKDMDWSDKWDIAECRDHPYWQKTDGSFQFFHGTKHIKAKQVLCISFQGSSEFLQSVVDATNFTSIMFDRAEIATHMKYGEADYWMCRRSMRFAKHLVEEANVFRASHLNSTDESDKTVLPTDWRDETSDRSAQGGSYLGVHLRRQDFVYGRPKEVPSLEESASQIKRHLNNLNLNTVFVATDMTVEEYKYLEQLLAKDNVKIIKYKITEQNIENFKEGGLAIIDQIIASHARFFVGTHESTFSYRIQEEREIMGFPASTTFNRFCPTSDSNKCTPPSKWLIKYPEISSQKMYVNFKSGEL